MPVGEDQAQHLELTRDIAQRFNSLYGETFVDARRRSLPAVGARIMGLDDPTQENEQIGHRHRPCGEPARSSGRDPQENHARHHGFQSRGGFRNHGPRRRESAGHLSGLHRNAPDGDLHAHFAGMRYGDLKKTVAGAVIAAIEPIQKRYAEIMSEQGYVARVLREGAEKITPIAEGTVEVVKKAMGLYTAS